MIELAVGDIARLEVNVIVNAANSGLQRRAPPDHSMYSITFTTR
jgi:hypothetical protein